MTIFITILYIRFEYLSYEILHKSILLLSEFFNNTI